VQPVETVSHGFTEETSVGMIAGANAGFRKQLDNMPVLEIEGLRKTFGGIKALDGVNLTLAAGEIHALVGENGAGKSTLIRILTGAFPRDTGTIRLNGAAFNPQSPLDSKVAGIQCVYQELNILPDLSIAENVMIERFPRTGLGLVDFKALAQRAVKALDAVGLGGVDPEAPARTMGIAQRQLIEIARALSGRSRILILDEPTATLTDREVERLSAILRKLRAEGLSILFVSHHLDEVFRLCDRVTIFRNGTTVRSDIIASTTPDLVVRHMVGRTLQTATAASRPAAPKTSEVLAVADLKTNANVNGQSVSFHVCAGEIVGIGGLAPAEPKS
jgi:ribose transport system ATP-binding protein